MEFNDLRTNNFGNYETDKIERQKTSKKPVSNKILVFPTKKIEIFRKEGRNIMFHRCIRLKSSPVY